MNFTKVCFDANRTEKKGKKKIYRKIETENWQQLLIENVVVYTCSITIKMSLLLLLLLDFVSSFSVLCCELRYNPA